MASKQTIKRTKTSRVVQKEAGDAQSSQCSCKICTLATGKIRKSPTSYSVRRLDGSRGAHVGKASQMSTSRFVSGATGGGQTTSHTTYCIRQVDGERTEGNDKSEATYALHRAVRKRSLSPTRAGRQEEKEQLQDLNDRFASYIDRVRYLEGENRRLVSQVRVSEQNVSQGVENIKSLYDSELDDARRLLEEMSTEKARLEHQVGITKADSEEWRTKYYSLNSDRQNTDRRILELEAHLAEIHGKFSEAENLKVHFEKKHTSTYSELLTLERQVEKAKKQLEEESLLRTDLENRCQTLKEDLAFKTQVFEQELSSERASAAAVRVDEVDAGSRVEYEAKLKEALWRMRSEQDGAIQATKVEVEAMYERKIGDLQTALQRSQNSGTSSRDDMIASRRQLAELSSETSQLKTQMAQYESRIADLESRLRTEQDGFFSRIADKDSQIGELRKSLDEQLKEFAHLMDIKIRLDTEIAAYRKLLESEESRLNMSQYVEESTPSKRIKVIEERTLEKEPISQSCAFGSSRTITSGNSFGSNRFQNLSKGIAGKATSTRVLKRKRVANDDLDGIVELGQQSSSNAEASQMLTKGSVEIYEIDPHGKFIKLFNATDKDIYLGGWQLKHMAGNQETVYKFHHRVILQGGMYTTVWSSDAGEIPSPPSTLVMKGYQWGVAGETKTTLYNNGGYEVASRETMRFEPKKSTSYLHDLKQKVVKGIRGVTGKRTTRKTSQL